VSDAVPKVVVSSSDDGDAEVVGVAVAVGVAAAVGVTVAVGVTAAAGAALAADAAALTVADGTGYDLAVTKEVCTLRTRNMTATAIKATAMTTKTIRTTVACPLPWKPIARVPICPRPSPRLLQRS
jgi:hypothetical protein